MRNVFLFQAYAEQEWYVGRFSRVEAEHALHLVNRVNPHPKHTHLCSITLMVPCGNGSKMVEIEVEMLIYPLATQ